MDPASASGYLAIFSRATYSTGALIRRSYVTLIFKGNHRGCVYVAIAACIYVQQSVNIAIAMADWTTNAYHHRNHRQYKTAASS